jgi:hypothetical protein
MARPNEYFMLRRAARHLVVGLWTSDHLWSKQERILEVYAAVKLLKEVADTLPDKQSKKRWSWFAV